MAVDKRQVRDGNTIIVEEVGGEAEASSEAYFRLSDVIQGKVELGNGVKLRPLDLNDLARIEDEFGSTEAFEKSLKTGSVRNIRKVLWILMVRDDPGLTEEQVGQMFTMDSMPRIHDALQQVLSVAGNSPDATTEPGNPVASIGE